MIEQDITFQIEAKLFHLTGDYRSRRPQLVQEQLEDTLNEMLRDSSIQDLLVKRVVSASQSVIHLLYISFGLCVYADSLEVSRDTLESIHS
ncbi:hypothetical protein D3C80_1710260 [compost metagenome]